MEVEVSFTHDDGEPETRHNPGVAASIELDTVTVIGDDSQVDILARLPRTVLAEIEDECWDAIKAFE